MTKVRSRLRVEALEGREVPAATGFPWGNAGHLTLSFAPNGTDVAGQTNDLTGTFANASNYQTEILRAFQTWAVQANINVAFHGDSGDPFGSPGNRQGDPRFGDVRIAAATLGDESVSVSAPHDPFLAGTWSGDVVFNKDTAFGGTGADVYSVTLHEAGHVLGLGHNPDPNSVMFSHLAALRTGLAPADIASLRALYGTRANDVYDAGLGNASLAAADSLNRVAGLGFTWKTPVAVFADITTLKDKDTFSVRVPAGYTGALSFRVQTAGVSLLAPKVTVYDHVGRVLKTATSTDPTGSVLTLTIDRVAPGRKYFVRVESATQDAFGIGTYALAATMDGRNTVSEATIDRVLRGPYRTLEPADLRQLFQDPNGLVNDDHGLDDDRATASRLTTSPGYPDKTHYETIASISLPAAGISGGHGGGGGESGLDVDNYRLRTPKFTGAATGVLTATVWTLSGDTPPAVQVLDRHGNPVPADILANGNGTYTVQAVGVEGNRDYYVVLGGATPGNYSLVVDLTTRPADVIAFAQDTMTAAQPNVGQALYVAQSQVFDFLLSAAGPAGSSVRMTVFDKVPTGQNTFALRQRFVLTAAAGETVSGPAVFLNGGAYEVVFEGLNGATGYTLRGAGLTIPIGPIARDPTLKPVFTPPGAPPGQYVYPGNLVGYDPYLAQQIAALYQIAAGQVGQTIVASTSPFMMLPVQQP